MPVDDAEPVVVIETVTALVEVTETVLDAVDDTETVTDNVIDCVDVKVGDAVRVADTVRVSEIALETDFDDVVVAVNELEADTVGVRLNVAVREGEVVNDAVNVGDRDNDAETVLVTDTETELPKLVEIDTVGELKDVQLGVTDVDNVNETLAVVVAVVDTDEPKLEDTESVAVDVGVIDGDGSITSVITACGGNTNWLGLLALPTCATTRIKLGYRDYMFFGTVTAAYTERTGAAASVERRRREPARAISPKRLARGGASPFRACTRSNFGN